MSKIKLQTDLGPIEFSSPEEAAAFFQAMRKAPVRHAPTEMRAPRVTSSDEPIDVRVFKLVLDAGPDGIAATELSDRLGLEGPRGLSSVGRPIADRLLQMGFTFDDVLERERVKKKTGDGFYTRWKAKEKLRSVLEDIEEGLR